MNQTVCPEIKTALINHGINALTDLISSCQPGGPKLSRGAYHVLTGSPNMYASWASMLWQKQYCVLLIFLALNS